MAGFCAARLVLRSAPLRTATAAAAIASSRTIARPSLRLLKSPAARFLRSPVEASCCVESLLPLHSATASAVMNSMLAISRRGNGWVSEGS